MFSWYIRITGIHSKSVYRYRDNCLSLPINDDKWNKPRWIDNVYYVNVLIHLEANFFDTRVIYLEKKTLIGL